MNTSEKKETATNKWSFIISLCYFQLCFLILQPPFKAYYNLTEIPFGSLALLGLIGLGMGLAIEFIMKNPTIHQKMIVIALLLVLVNVAHLVFD